MRVTLLTLSAFLIPVAFWWAPTLSSYLIPILLFLALGKTFLTTRTPVLDLLFIFFNFSLSFGIDTFSNYIGAYQHGIVDTYFFSWPPLWSACYWFYIVLIFNKMNIRINSLTVLYSLFLTLFNAFLFLFALESLDLVFTLNKTSSTYIYLACVFYLIFSTFFILARFKTTRKTIAKS